MVFGVFMAMASSPTPTEMIYAAEVRHKYAWYLKALNQ